MAKKHDFDISKRERELFEISKKFDDDKKYGPNEEMRSPNHFMEYTQVEMEDDNGKRIRVEDHRTKDGGRKPHKHSLTEGETESYSMSNSGGCDYDGFSIGTGSNKNSIGR